MTAPSLSILRNDLITVTDVYTLKESDHLAHSSRKAVLLLYEHVPLLGTQIKSLASTRKLNKQNIVMEVSIFLRSWKCS